MRLRGKASQIAQEGRLELNIGARVLPFIPSKEMALAVVAEGLRAIAG